MADAFAWTDLGRWLFSFQRLLPDRILRWAWSEDQLLARVRVFTAAEPPPHLFVRVERENPELTHLGFHVVNLTPFKLGIVAASAQVTLDSRELFLHEQRFVTEITLGAYDTGSFQLRHQLTGPQADRLRNYPHTSARIRMDGGIILRTPLGERRKPISCDLDARIDR